MKELVAIFHAAGAAEVQTLIQSGNVVFAAPASAVEELVETVQVRIEERYEMRVPVVHRSAAEFRAALEQNPFLANDVDPTHLHIGFLLDRPEGDAVDSLDPDRSDVDSFALRDRHLYLHVPGGMARTKLTNAWFDRRLGTVVTMRSWRTAGRLMEMLESERDS